MNANWKQWSSVYCKISLYFGNLNRTKALYRILWYVICKVNVQATAYAYVHNSYNIYISGLYHLSVNVGMFYVRMWLWWTLHAVLLRCLFKQNTWVFLHSSLIEVFVWLFLLTYVVFIFVFYPLYMSDVRNLLLSNNRALDVVVCAIILKMNDRLSCLKIHLQQAVKKSEFIFSRVWSQVSGLWY